MTFLPDVNVWIALTSARHVHQPIADQWLKDLGDDRIAFCRISELGFLRLLTNAHVMGNDVLTPAEAWHVYDEWRADDRVVFLPERLDFSEEWRHLGQHLTGGPNVWTDGYLAAFARNANATIVTLDRSFVALGSVAIQLFG
jgi:toxin-antitoxin system PIN domain toxin